MSGMQSYDVLPFNSERLVQLFASAAFLPAEVIRDKDQVRYFQGYLDRLQAKTIVVENKYIDRDFLEDFAGYYVRCFADYPRTCARLHFFDTIFSREAFDSVLRGTPREVSIEKFRNSYLGFIVVKPLPETIVGRTCLKTYATADGKHREYPTIQRCTAHLFGIDLEVWSVDFQEQDQVVAACATSALWSAFHCTSTVFNHSVPSPLEITRAANTYSANRTRYLNAGLTPEQMAQAIRHVGLEPVWESTKSIFLMRSTLHAYLKCGFPVILGVKLFDTSQPPDSPQFLMGHHAVTVTGFRVSRDSDDFDTFRSPCNQIDRIFAHDDQIGPFARMKFETTPIRDPIEDTVHEYSLSTVWRSDLGVKDVVRAAPYVMLVPLYHKIRIPLDLVQNTIIEFDGIIEVLRSENQLTIDDRLIWDIYLTTVRQVKKSLLEDLVISPEIRHELLTTSFPKFMWRATANGRSGRLLDLFFDATDIEQGKCITNVVVYGEKLRKEMVTIANDVHQRMIDVGQLCMNVLREIQL